MSCNICLTNEPINPITTPCKHMFCFKCIEEWMYHKLNCPCCRRKFDINEVLGYYHEYSDEIITRSKTIEMRRMIVMKNINKKLNDLNSTQNRKKKEKYGYDVLKYVYINRSVFGSEIDPITSNLFLKTVFQKSLHFYEKNNCKNFYEWVFKFRNYMKLLNINF